MRLLAQIVFQLALAAISFFKEEAERRRRAALVRADPGTHWLRRFGGTRQKDNSQGPIDPGCHSD